MRAFIIAVAVVIALVVIAKAEDTTTPKSTFFGVDRNDEDAMRAKHQELADEQYKRMFGEDHPLPDFYEDVDPEPTFTQKVREAVKKFGDLFKIKPSTTEAPKPMD